MDSLRACTELMHNALPGRCIEPGGVFFAVRGSDEQPLLFSIGSDQRLYVVKSDSSDRENVEQDLSKAFKLPDGHVIHSLAVTQDLSLAIHIVFATGPPNAKSDIRVVRPVNCQDIATWSASSDLSPLLLAGQSKDVHVEKLHLATSAQALDSSPYPAIFIQFRRLARSTFDFCPIVVNEKGTGWVFNEDLQSPIDSHRILDLRAATVRGRRGLFALTQEGTPEKPVSQLRLLSLFESGGVVTLQDFVQKCPPQACRIATVTTPDGNDDLLIAGDGLHCLNGDDCLRGLRGPDLQKLSSDKEYSKPLQLHVAQEAANVSVWAQSAEHDVCYQGYHSSGDSALQHAGPVVPMLLHNAGGGNFSATRGVDGGQRLFIVGIQGGHPALTMLAQNASTRLWQSSPVLIPAFQDVVRFVSYTSHVELRDADGLPLPDREVLISTSIPTELIVNGSRTATDKLGKPVCTDTGGSLTIIVPGTEESLPANCPVITLASVAGSNRTFRGLDLIISPGEKLSTAVEKLASMGELKSLRQKGLIPADVTDDHLQKAAGAFGSLKEAAGSLNSQGELDTSKTRLSGGSAGTRVEVTGSNALAIDDLWVLIKEGFESVISWTIEKMHDGWAFVLELADGTYQLVVKAISHVVQAAVKVLEFVKMGVEKIIEYVGFVFEWDDIVATKNILANLTTQGMIWTSDNVDTVQASSDRFFSDLKSMVLDLKTKSLPPSLQKATVGRNAAKKASDTNKDIATQARSPGMCWGEYQLQHGGKTVASQQMRGSKSGPTDGMDPDVWDEIGTLVENLTINLSKVFKPSSDMPIGELLLDLGVDLLADMVGVIGKMVSQLVGLFRQLIVRLAGSITTEVDIPILSPMYKSVSGGNPLTAMDAVFLVMAIPVTVSFKLFTGKSPTQIDGVAYLTKPNIYLAELRQKLRHRPLSAASASPRAQPVAATGSAIGGGAADAQFLAMPAAVTALENFRETRASGPELKQSQLAKDYDRVAELMDRGVPICVTAWFNLWTVPGWSQPHGGPPRDDKSLIAALFFWGYQGLRVGEGSVPGFYWRLACWYAGAISVCAQSFPKRKRCALQMASSILQLMTSIGSYWKLFDNGVPVDTYSMVEDLVIVLGKGAAAAADNTLGINPYFSMPAMILHHGAFAMRVLNPVSTRVGYRSGMDLQF